MKPRVTVTSRSFGDVSAADLKTAGRAGREAEIVVADIRALLEGNELQAYEPMPPAILIPLDRGGSASELPGQDEVVGAETTAAIKRRAHVRRHLPRAVRPRDTCARRRATEAPRMAAIGVDKGRQRGVAAGHNHRAGGLDTGCDLTFMA
jgi:hypothetical protein